MQLLTAQPILDKLQPFNPTNRTASLAIILVGHNIDSEQYVAIKQREAARYGITVHVERFLETVANELLLRAITALNGDNNVHGIIVQLPLPAHLDTDTVLNAIHPSKDVDNLTSLGRFESPMVQAIAALATHYAIDFAGKRLCIIGHGRLAGRPIRQWLEKQNHEPIVIDEETENSDYIIREADVIFAGSGKQHIIHAENTREGQVIFDCSGRDVDFEAIKEKAEAITPPKGSIGPLTVHFLFTNVLLAAQQ